MKCVGNKRELIETNYSVVAHMGSGKPFLVISRPLDPQTKLWLKNSPASSEMMSAGQSAE
jgi:hypothetical protein